MKITLAFIWGIVHFCTIDGFFRILKKTSSKLICTRLYLHIQDLILTWLFQDAPNHTSSETNLEDNKTNEATGLIENAAKTASENVDEDTQTPIKRQKTVSFSENVEQEQVIEEATEGKSSLKSALQLLDEIDDEISKCYIPSKSALQLLAEIL